MKKCDCSCHDAGADYCELCFTVNHENDIIVD